MAVFIVGTFLLRFIFSSVYLQQIGLSSLYSGIILSTSRLAQAIGGLSLGYLADKADKRDAILAMSYLAYAITPLLITLPKPVYKCTEKPLINYRKSNLTRQKEKKGATINLSRLPAERYPEPRFQKNMKGSTDDQNLDEISKQTRGEYPNDRQVLMEKRKIFERNKTIFLPVFQDNSTARVLNVTNNIGTQNINITNVSRKHQENRVTFFYLLLIMVTGDFLGGATINLFDALVVSTIDDKKEYAKIRMWGNFAQAFIIPLTAIITYFKKVEICGISQSDFKIALYITSAISGVGWFFAMFKVRMPSSKIKDDKEKSTNTAASFKELIAPIETWSLLTMSLFFGIFISSLSSFLFWTMVELNPSQANLSIAVANFLKNLAALLVYNFVPTILHAIGYRNALNCSCLAFAASFATASLMFTPWLGVVVEVLASIAFCMAMSACVSYLGEVAHPSIAVTAQGLLHFLFSGAGPALGPFLAGLLLHISNQTITYVIFCGISIAVMVFSIVVQWIMKMRETRYQRLATSGQNLSS
ncbi:major facilitator superfamily domain-containing protein 6-like [Exaiptasia diaphana]|uniref:Major facilitator superfamily associated domain-containing protein n=1 Tax=Exaiptasia diaphana TaxID=2652724 RepID=A0A913X4Z4_EXADI|nr:major facilitator superfamily domain-containing protein 6-like [Exaiptasia diaphana]